MTATVSSRTPEGEPNLCPVCGALVCIDPSGPSGDAPCPSCGVLLWFLAPRTACASMRRTGSPPSAKDVADVLARLLRIRKEELTRSFSSIEDFGLYSLDIVELVMELEEEFEFTIPDAEAEGCTIGDLIDWLIRRLQ